MDNLRGEIAERLQQLRASREQHQQQLEECQQIIPQLTARINAETGAIAELERLLKPETEKTEPAPKGE